MANKVAVLSLAVASTGCITTLRSPFPVRGPAHVVHVSGPSIPAWDDSGWGLMPGSALAYDFRYGWTPRSGTGFAHEVGIRVGHAVVTTAGPQGENAGSTTQVAASYQISRAFDDGRVAVALEASLPAGLLRTSVGRRFGGTTAYLQGTLAPPSCNNCAWNMFAGAGLERHVGKHATLLVEAATSLTTTHLDVWTPDTGVWKRQGSGVLVDAGLRWSR